MHDFLKAAKALSDETRLRILYLLLERECCVCEVMDALNVSQTRASRNLNILLDAGFLKVRKEGLWSYYSIKESNPRHFLSVLLNSLEIALKNDKIASSDRKKLETAKRLGPQVCKQ